MTTQCCFMPLHLHFKKIDIFSELLKKNDQHFFHIFMGRFIVYYLKTFQPYITCQALFQLIFDKIKCPKTVQRGLLNLKGSKIKKINICLFV